LGRRGVIRSRVLIAAFKTDLHRYRELTADSGIRIE
jgi:hypothetical protein